MSLKPLSPITPDHRNKTDGQHRRCGTGRAGLRRYGRGLLAELATAPVVVNDPPGTPVTFPIGKLFAPGFNTMRLHMAADYAAPGGQIVVDVVLHDPTTEIAEPQALAIRVMDTGPLGAGAGQLSVGNANPISIPAAFPLWLFTMQATQILAGGQTTITSLKVWLGREL